MEIKYYGDKILPNQKAISLCGPTPRNNKTKGWRMDAIKILKKLNYDGIVYIPESNGEKLFFKNKEEQMMWERNCYINSNIIVFWVPRKFPNMLGLTTNVEFGYWLKIKKCIYGRPKNAYRTDYLDWLYNLEYHKKPYDTLEELITETVALLEENNR